MNLNREKPAWQWNEMQQIGTDYNSLAEVDAYDRRMASFRDVETENRSMLDQLNLPAGAKVLEIGCGTGRFARAAAGRGLSVTAVDVSAIMLEYVTTKAKEENLGAIETQHAGFLTMQIPACHFDAVVSGAALHHLPDAWKFVALQNIHRCLKPAGQFILRDVVFVVPENNPMLCFQRFVESFSEVIQPGAIGHVSREFSTFDWVMEGLLTRAGLEILTQTQAHESFLVYHCRKPDRRE